MTTKKQPKKKTPGVPLMDRSGGGVGNAGRGGCAVPVKVRKGRKR